MTSASITLPRPDDWHLHLRSGALLEAVIAPTARDFARAIIMPNLSPPVTTQRDAIDYRAEILAALPAHARFEPLMTSYLTDHTDAGDLCQGAARGVFAAAKLYPAGATTNAAAGVTRIEAMDEVFAAMASCQLPLLVHGEVVSPDIDIFDREAAFIKTVLDPLRRRHPTLKVVLEHITTSQAVEYVLDADPDLLCATITAHHLALNRNAMFSGGIRPHAYCLPVIKRESHRRALVRAACSGDTHFFLGTDSAPHPRHDKESACGCAGIFSAPTAMATYLEIFHQADALHHFEAFASVNGPRFYGLPVNREQLTYRRGDVTPVPGLDSCRDRDVVVFEPPFDLLWTAHREH